MRYKEFGIKQYIGKNEQTGEDQYITHRDDKAMGYSIEQNSNRAIYMDFSVNYQRTFDKHSVAGMLLLNRRQYDNLSAGTSIMNLPYRSQGWRCARLMICTAILYRILMRAIMDQRTFRKESEWASSLLYL